MKISKAGFGANSIFTIAVLLLLFSFMVGFGIPWLFIFIGIPVLLKMLSRMWVEESLLINPQDVLHERVYVSALTLRTSKKSDPSMKVFLVETNAHAQMRKQTMGDQSRANLVLATPDFKITLGRSLDYADKVWIRKNLTDALFRFHLK